MMSSGIIRTHNNSSRRKQGIVKGSRKRADDIIYRKLLKNDHQKNESSKEKAKEALKDKCRVSAEIKMPKMIQALHKLLPPDSLDRQKLNKIMKRE